MTSQELEIQRLRAELARLRQETDALRAGSADPAAAPAAVRDIMGGATGSHPPSPRAGAREAIFAAAFEHAPILMTISSVEDGTCLDANRRFLEVSGFTRPEVLGRTSTQLGWLHPADRRKIIAELKTKGRVDGMELDLTTGDGRRITCLYHGELIEVEGAQRLLSIALDITARKEMERELLASREFARSIIDNSDDCIKILDMEGRLRYMSPGGTGTLGICDLSPYLGMAYEKLWQGSDEPRALEALRLAREGGQGRFQGFCPTVDGQPRWWDVSVSAIPGPDGRPERLLAVSRDITEYRQAMEALRASEERFHQLYENAPIAYQSLDPEGLLLEANQAWLKTLGYDREEVLGRWFGSFLEEDFIPHFEKNFPSFKEAGSISGVEFKMRRKDGSSLLVSFNGAIAYDQKGQMARSHCVFQDITEHRRLEAQLRQSQKMEAIGTLAGGIAHDFNNILGAVLGFAELAKDMAQTGENNSDELDQIIAAAERARNLVRQILTFSRKMDASLRPLDLNQALSRVLPLLERTIPRMIEIRTNLQVSPGLILADQDQIGQIVMNLARNSADAMPAGGRLAISTARLDLDEEFCQSHLEVKPGPYVLLKVSDTGQGMNTATLEHIFEPFFTTKEVGKGTGLGLSTVFGIVKAHGGHIHCHSRPGMGTTMSLYLPVWGEAEAGQPRQDGEGSGRVAGGRETLLVVDDEEPLLEVASRALTSEGYRVIKARRGEEALEVLQTHPGPIDLILLDLGMPGMGGLECLRRILASLPQAQVLITSGYAAEEDARKALAAGAWGFVSKPWSRGDLLASVRRTLDRSAG